VAPGGPQSHITRRDAQQAPEITRASPPGKRENHEKYATDASPASGRLAGILPSFRGYGWESIKGYG